MDQMSMEFFDHMEAGLALLEIITNEAGEQDMQFLFANEYYAVRYGHTPQSIKNQLFSIVDPHDVAWIPMFAEVAFRKIPAYPFESYSVDWEMYAHSQLFSPKEGQVAIILHDRNNFVKEEIAKEREEQGTRLLMGTMPEGLCYGRAVSDESGELVDIDCIVVNEAFEIFMGLRVGSLQGNRFFELYPEGPKADLVQINQAMRSKKTMTFIREGVTGHIIEFSLYPQEQDQLVVIVRDVTERVKAEQELAQAHKTILSSISYAGKIQRNLLPGEEAFQKAFKDYSVIWEPRDIVGGDILWLKSFEQGSVLCVCDCTGHGTSGALLTMLVASAFDDYVEEDNCCDTAGILWNLEQKLVSVFNRKSGDDSYDNKDGCDLAVLFIAKEGNVRISSSHMHVYICDGKEVTQLKGQRIFIGEGEIKEKQDIEVIEIPANPDNTFYIASDGLTDQPGGPHSRPYGYGEFKRIILENHDEEQAAISDKIWNAFEAWRGAEARVDDFELISFKI